MSDQLNYNSAAQSEFLEINALYYNAINPTTITFENEKVKAFVNSLGHIEFFDMEDNSLGFVDVPVSDDPSEKAHSAQYGTVRYMADGSKITFKMPLYDWIDYYPNCDGESDRWNRITVRWFDVVFDCSTGQINVNTDKPGIVILDGYAVNPGDLSWEGLEELGQVTVYDRTAYEECDLIAERIGDAEVAVLSKTPISKATIDKCPNLKAIAVLATGYNVVDCTAAKERGIAVMNVPSYGTQIVAQYAVSHLLEICANVSLHDKAVKAGAWEKCPDWCFWEKPVIELAGKTAGIIGLGRIGRATAGILKALGMNVLGSSAHKFDEEEAGVKWAEPEEIFSQSDVIFLHCPMTPETAGIINRDTIAKMKDGVIIINNSRGQLIVEQDLADALNCGKVYAAGLDVVSSEPIKGDNPLLTAKNCFITPHISWAATDARQRLLNITIDNVRLWAEGKPQNVVNM